MHRAHRKRKTIIQEGHNSLCPYRQTIYYDILKKIEDGGNIMTEKIITKKEVEYVAKLAKLEFDEEEKEEFTSQLNSILDYFKKLNELNTEKVEPTAYVVSMPNLLNEDEVKPSLPQNEVLVNSKYVKKCYFKVPKIM
jgi:aspartyl-tRNA(Asn)/glutamyl-tRNA(Gln) amidotransferase subunit C